MGLVNNFFVPLFEVTGFLLVFGVITFFSCRAFIRVWDKSLKFWVTYCFRIPKLVEPKCVDQADADWIFESSKKFSRAKLEMFLLCHDYKKDRVYELLFLYDLLKKNGGLNHVIKAEQCDREVKKQIISVS